MFNSRKLANALKSQEQVVAEIHEEFDTATDRLLKEAKEIIGGSYNLEKAARLKSLGFVKSKRVSEAAEKVQTLAEKTALAETIEYFNSRYKNKFITESEVQRICKKYGLICGASEKYIGDIPEKNLSEIESFSLNDEDKTKAVCGEVYQYRSRFSGSSISLSRFSSKMEGSSPYYNDYLYIGYGATTIDSNGRDSIFVSAQEGAESILITQPFKICAPVKDFDTKDMHIEDGYKLLNAPKDPIVLQPVRGGYLIVTKWGLEADDEIVK